MHEFNDANRELPRTPEVPLGELPTDVLWRMSLDDGSIEYTSREVELTRGVTPEETAQQPMHEILTPDSLARVGAQMEEWRRLAAADEPLPGSHFVLRYYRKDGTTYPCEVLSTPRRRADGTIEIIGISRALEEIEPAGD